MKGIVEDCSRVAGSVKYMISNLSFAEICSSRLGLDIRNYARFGGTINQGMDLVEKHKVQIELYKEVLFHYFNMPVKGYVYYLETNQVVEV